VDIPRPGPGGFASTGPFAPRPGSTPVLAQTHALIGRYGTSNGPGPPPYHGPSVAAWVFCIAVLAAIVLAIVNTVTRKG
jgi:hypothetical protein